MNILTIVQARTSSSRLPNKVLFPLCGEPLLIRIIERIQKSSNYGKVVIATSTNKDDDIIEGLCKAHETSCFRGHLSDLLDRHYKAAVHYGADAIVKIPSDCPLIDPKIIDKVIAYYIDHYPKFDFVSNLHPASYPDGNDIEIMSFGALKKTWQEATRSFEREHTTPYIWENPRKFNMGNVVWETGSDFSSTHRWTIDYQEDYEFINRVFEELYPRNPAFGLGHILALIHNKPEIAAINQKYVGKYWYENHLNDLKNINEYKFKNEVGNNSFS